MFGVYCIQGVKMKMCSWRLLVSDYGGLTAIVKKAVYQEFCGDVPMRNIKIHAYREVGESLEATYEIQIGKKFLWRKIVL